MHDPIRKMIKPKSPILYLHEYRHVPEEILLWKNDEHLTPWNAESCPPPEISQTAAAHTPVLPPLLCVGIGTYKTLADGRALSLRPHRSPVPASVQLVPGGLPQRRAGGPRVRTSICDI